MTNDDGSVQEANCQINVNGTTFDQFDLALAGFSTASSPLQSEAPNVPDSTTIAVSCGTFNGTANAKLTAIGVDAIN